MYNFFSSDCGAKDSEGKRPLHFAAHGKGSHAKDVVDVLIEEAASHIGNLVHYIIMYAKVTVQFYSTCQVQTFFQVTYNFILMWSFLFKLKLSLKELTHMTILQTFFPFLSFLNEGKQNLKR